MTTGNPTIDGVLMAIAGLVTALYVFFTALATILPKDWPFTHWCAQVAADLRKIRSGGDSATESARRYSTRPKVPPVAGAALMVFLVSCSGTVKQDAATAASIADRIDSTIHAICGADMPFSDCERAVANLFGQRVRLKYQRPITDGGAQ